MTPTTQNQSPPGTELTLLSLDSKARTAIDKIEAVSHAYAVESARPALGQLVKAVITARGIQMLREALTDQVLDFFMPLMNTAIGFKTDRVPGNKKNLAPYSKAQVREVFVQALLKGIPLIGNHLNIISEQLYITKEGYEHKVGGVPGLSNLEVIPGTPTKNQAGKTVIRMAVRWKMSGQRDELRDHEGKPGRVFEIPANEYSGPDQIVGKGKRKALKAAWEQIMGSEYVLDSFDDDETAGALTRANGGAITQSKADALADALPAAPGEAKEAPGESAPAEMLQQVEAEVRRAGWEGPRIAAWLSERKVHGLQRLTAEQAHGLLEELRAGAREPGDEGPD